MSFFEEQPARKKRKQAARGLSAPSSSFNQETLTGSAPCFEWQGRREGGCELICNGPWGFIILMASALQEWPDNPVQDEDSRATSLGHSLHGVCLDRRHPVHMVTTWRRREHWGMKSRRLCRSFLTAEAQTL